MPTEMELTLEQSPTGVSYGSLEHQSDSFTMKMEISCLSQQSNKLMVRLCNMVVDWSDFQLGLTRILIKPHCSYRPDKHKVIMKAQVHVSRLPATSDTTHLSRSVEVLKLKKFQERCNIKAFQEWYEHVGPEVTSPQGGKVIRWRRDCAWLMISRCSRSQCQNTSSWEQASVQEVNVNTNIHKRKDFQDSPDDEEDTKSSHEYLNDLEEKYQARALLANSRIFFKMVYSRHSPVQKATDKLECHKCGQERVSSDDNEMVEDKVLMELAEENDAINKEGARNGNGFDEKQRKHIFQLNKEVSMIAPRVRDVYVLDMTSSTQESYFFAKASDNLN
ncbi:hypothetical protein Tco_1247709 [Tanacetum coccineum]